MARLKIWNDTLAEWQYVDGGESGGSQTIVDLGIVDVVDLLDGPQTLATPDAGSLYYVIPSPVGFVQADGGGVDIAPTSRITEGGISHPLLQWQPGVPYSSIVAGSWNYAVADGTPVKAVASTYQSAYPILSALVAWQANHVYPAEIVMILGPDDHVWVQTAGGTSGGTIPDFASGPPANPAVRQTSTVYAPGDEVYTVDTSPFSIWATVGGGTSTGDPITFELPGPVTDNDISWTYARPGGSITDGTVFWVDEGAIPTAGSLHVYALTADAA